MEFDIPTATEQACLDGDAEKLKTFHKKGFPLTDNCPGYACYGGNLEIVKYIQSLGYHIEPHLWQACLSKRNEVIYYLIEQGCKVDEHCFWLTCLNGDVDMCRFMLKHGANPNAHGIFNCLFVTCQHGHVNILKLLVEHGVDLSYQDENGQTAVDIAVKYQKNKVISYIQGEPEYSSWSKLFSMIF